MSKNSCKFSDDIEIKYRKYLAPQCSPDEMDTFLVRQAILSFIKNKAKEMHGYILDVGCGDAPYKYILECKNLRKTTYFGLDIKTDIYTGRDLEWDGKVIPMSCNVIDFVILTEVLEHIPMPSAVLSEIYRVLKPGGEILITVPFLWNIHDPPNDEYRFTPYSLSRLLKEGGFENINIKAMGGWDASLAQMIGLWTRRRPMRKFFRKILSYLIRPVYGYLISIDDPLVTFSEGPMVTGLSCTAEKTKF